MYEHLRLCDWWAGCPESGGEALPIHRLHLRLRHGPRDWSQPRQASHWSTSLFSRHFFNLAPFLKFSIAANFVYVMAHEIGHNLGMPPLKAFLSLVHFHFFPPFFEFGAFFKILQRRQHHTSWPTCAMDWSVPGMSHDSSGNTCDADGFIMSPSRGTKGEGFDNSIPAWRLLPKNVNSFAFKHELWQHPESSVY